MGCIFVAFILLTIFVIYKVVVIYKSLSDPHLLPQFNYTQNWTDAQTTTPVVSEAIPFKITTTSEEIDLLRERIAAIGPKLPAPLHGIAFEYGINSDQFSSILAFWKDDYLARWSERLDYLNRIPQFTKTIQGLNLHYIHTNNESANNILGGRTIVPLLLLHGWPGSVREFYDIIPRLTAPDAVLFNATIAVVAPSLPGYGWSEAATRPGFGVGDMSIVLRNLMLSLGYERFYVQGGDFGAMLGSSMATIFPANVIGFHSNMLLAGTPMSYVKGFVASYWPSLFVPTEHQPFFFPMAVKLVNLILETGYLHQQASKPDTIGIALTDNPVGVAAYILEKFLTWTEPAGRSLPDGGWAAFEPIYRDAILDNIMVYVLSGSITTSMRLYAEQFAIAQGLLSTERVPTVVPTACARFINDMQHSMDWQLQEKYRNLIQSTYYMVGGHFAAMEKPDLLYDDLVEFVRNVNRLNSRPNIA